MKCPRCQSTNFVQNKYEGVNVDTCQGCFGVWLDEGELLEIVSVKQKKISTDLVKEVVSNSFYGIPESEKENKLLCAHCNNEMKPINYDISSGVIIDRCNHGHGIWLDKHELEKVQAFREYWSEQVQSREKEFLNILESNESKKVNSNSNSALFSLAEFFSKLF